MKKFTFLFAALAAVFSLQMSAQTFYKLTAVFPNGHEHTVFSNGTKLTAGATVPEGAISAFEVVSRNEADSTMVLKAGDNYLHWSSGDDANKSSDLDGLNEEYDEAINVLKIFPASIDGASTSAEWGKTAEDVEGLWQIQGQGTGNFNGRWFDYTLREKDDEWIAGNPGNYFFDTNWDGNGCRTSFFRVEEVVAPGTYVHSLDQLSADAAYTFTCPRGNFFSRSGENYLFGNFNIDFDETTDNKEFAIVKSHAGNYYLYSIGAQQFVGKDPDGLGVMVKDTPWDTFELSETSSEEYPWLVKMGGFMLNLTSWMDVNNLKMTNCDPDDGNMFNIVVSSIGHDLSEAIEAVDRYEGYIKDPVTVTYNYLVDGNVVFTESAQVEPGDSVPAIELPYGVAFAEGVEAPQAVAEENVSFDLNVVFGDYPFEYAASVESAKWYSWKMRNSGHDGGYAHYDGSGFPESEELGHTADYYWAFIGTPFGFEVVNYYDITKRLAGRGTQGKGNKPLYLGEPDEAVTFRMAPSEADNVWGECYMYVAGSPDECINDVSNGLGYWYTSAAHGDPGSQITFEELSLSDLVNTIKLIVDITDAPEEAVVVIDGKQYKHNDVAECDPLITVDDIFPSYFDGYHASVRIEGGIIYVSYAQYPFEITTDDENPIVYTMYSGRGNNSCWTFDENYIFIKQMNNSTDQFWYFKDYYDETDGQHYINIVPAADPTVVMGCTETSNGHTKVFGGHNGDEGFDARWVFVDEGEGYYGFKPASNLNTYLSNFGGTANRMGFYTDGPQRDGGTCITSFAPFVATEVWLEVQDNFGELYGQYRECDEVYDAIDALMEVSFGTYTYTEWMQAVADFYEAVKPYYIWFEEGKAYTFTNVQMDGTTYPFYMSTEGLAVGAPNSTAAEYGDSAIFVCHKSATEENKYSFTDCAYNYYLIWRGNNGWNGNHGYSASYEAEFCDLLIDYYRDEDRYFFIQGIRIDNCTGAFLIQQDGTFSGNLPDGYVKGWSETATSTFKIEEVPVPYSIDEMIIAPAANSSTYDLFGRKVTELQKGVIYVRDGKKFIER